VGEFGITLWISFRATTLSLCGSRLTTFILILFYFIFQGNHCTAVSGQDHLAGFGGSLVHVAAPSGREISPPPYPAALYRSDDSPGPHDSLAGGANS